MTAMSCESRTPKAARPPAVWVRLRSCSEGQDDGGGRKREDQSGGKGARKSRGQEAWPEGEARSAVTMHLQAAETEDGAAHAPELLGLEFQADEEEHHDDAEFGDVHHLG